MTAKMDKEEEARQDRLLKQMTPPTTASEGGRPEEVRGLFTPTFLAGNSRIWHKAGEDGIRGYIERLEAANREMRCKLLLQEGCVSMLLSVQQDCINANSEVARLKELCKELVGDPDWEAKQIECEREAFDAGFQAGMEDDRQPTTRQQAFTAYQSSKQKGSFVTISAEEMRVELGLGEEKK